MNSCAFRQLCSGECGGGLKGQKAHSHGPENKPECKRGTQIKGQNIFLQFRCPPGQVSVSVFVSVSVSVWILIFGWFIRNSFLELLRLFVFVCGWLLVSPIPSPFRIFSFSFSFSLWPPIEFAFIAFIVACGAVCLLLVALQSSARPLIFGIRCSAFDWASTLSLNNLCLYTF